MPQSLAALFVLGQWPPGWAWTVVAAFRQVFECRVLLQGLQHILGIVLPVGSKVQDSTGRQLFSQQGNKIRLHDAPFVMAFFRPGVGKIQAQTLQAASSNPLLQKLYTVSTDDAYIIDVQFLQLQQQMSDT